MTTTISEAKAKKSAANAKAKSKTLKVKAEGTEKEKHAIESKSFLGEAGLKVLVRLQHKNGKWLANAM